MDFSEFCINPVVFSNKIVGPDSSGDSGLETFSAGTPLMASFQPLSMNRILAHQAEGSLCSAQFFFVAPPVDTSANARTVNPACRTRDQISTAGRKFYALGPARSEGGVGDAWSVDCEERA